MVFGIFKKLNRLLPITAVALVATFSFQPANAATLDLAHPTLPLVAESGPFGYGGRGVIFRAEENFSMSSFAMEGRWDGQLDLGVDVYEVAAPGARNLLSSSAYANQTWSGNAFTSLVHAHNFVAGTIYEVMFRFSDPGIIFPHYDFNNPNNILANGFMVGTQMLVLDGSDYDTAENQNTWLAHFQMNTDPIDAIPVPAALPLLASGIALIGFAGRRRRRS